MEAPEIRAAEPVEHDSFTPAIEAVAELRSAVDERLTTELRGITDRLDAIDRRTQRPGNRSENLPDSQVIERRAFTGFLRHGREALAADEVRSLRVADDTAGGYLAPAQFVAEVIKGIVEVSPVRQAVRVGSTASGSVILPKRTGRPTARWVGETEARTETESSYGQVEIAVHESAAYVDVSLQLLEDAAINVEAEVASDLAEEFGRLEGAALVNGDGFKKPMGIMTDAAVASTPTGNASTLGTSPADLLITFLYSMPAVYRNSGAWMMNGSTLATLRKLKDGQGNYLWQPSYQSGQPETILGRPVVEAPDMDDIGSAAEPIIFGDFARAYRIYDRLALSVMRDPYTMATSGLVRFHARRRMGGGVVLSEAIRKIVCATS
ncbi:phage major capsid protein [Stappia sp. 22II-S9-Z10]|nr:phage major capsid protein [Stappia sp. 22II-S9-Z10]